MRNRHVHEQPPQGVHRVTVHMEDVWVVRDLSTLLM